MKILTALTVIITAITFSNASSVSDIIGSGVKLHDSGDYSGAISKYEEAVKLDPKNYTAYYEMCFTYATIHKYHDAAKQCKISIGLNAENNEAAFVQLGSIYDYLKYQDSAVAVYDEGIKVFPHSYMLKYNKAITEVGKKDISSALHTIESGLNDTKTHEGSYYTASYLSHLKGAWLDEISYGMYALLIGKTNERINETINRLYLMYKSLVNVTGKDSVAITIPRSGSAEASNQEIDKNSAFIMSVALVIAADSINSMPLYDNKVSKYDLLTYTSVKAINIQSEIESNNILKPFYAEITKNGYEMSFCRMIYSSVDPDAFKAWKKNNQEIYRKFIVWINEEYFKN